MEDRGRWVEWVARTREEQAVVRIQARTFGVSEQQAHRRHVCIVNHFCHYVASVFLRARSPIVREALNQEVIIARIVSFL